jgi:hypothetical protein
MYAIVLSTYIHKLKIQPNISFVGVLDPQFIIFPASVLAISLAISASIRTKCIQYIYIFLALNVNGMRTPDILAQRATQNPTKFDV